MNPYAGRNAPLLKAQRSGRRLGVSPGFPAVGNGLGGFPARLDNPEQDSPDMILIVDTSLPGASQTATLPLAGTVNCVVDWGDNVQEAFTTTGEKTHLYAAVGEYTIRISGTLTAFGANVARPEYKRLVAPGRRPFRTSWVSGFHNCTNIGKNFPTRMVDANVTSLANMFTGSNADPDVSQWDISNVTSLASMFYSNASANPDVSQWDTANVTTTFSLFRSAASARPDVSQWNMAEVTTMQRMFQGCPTNPDMSRWMLNTGITTMSDMLSTSGISIFNYSRALVRFANQVYLNNGPYNVGLSTGPKYHATVHADITGQFDNAPDARAFLAGAFTVTVSGASNADGNGAYTGATLTNAAGWTLTFLTNTWTLKDAGATAQASGTGNSRSPASVTTWTGTESGITVAQTGAGWTVTDGGAA